MSSAEDDARRTAVSRYQAALLQIRKQEANIATLHAELREQARLFRKSEEDIKALQVRLGCGGRGCGAAGVRAAQPCTRLCAPGLAPQSSSRHSL